MINSFNAYASLLVFFVSTTIYLVVHSNNKNNKLITNIDAVHIILITEVNYFHATITLLIWITVSVTGPLYLDHKFIKEK